MAKEEEGGREGGRERERWERGIHQKVVSSSRKSKPKAAIMFIPYMETSP